MRLGLAIVGMLAVAAVGCGGGDEQWDLVAIGDSTPTGAGAGGVVYTFEYAELLERDLGVEVEVHDHSTNSTVVVSEWVDRIADDDELLDALNDAEIVTIWLGWHNTIYTAMGFDGEWTPDVRDTFAACTDSMRRDFDDLLAVITDAAPDDVHVLIADTGIPLVLVERWSEEPFWPELKYAMYGSWRAALLEAADLHGATVIHTNLALGGPTGDVPPDESLIQPDAIHFSAEGHVFLAEVHRSEDGLGAD